MLSHGALPVLEALQRMIDDEHGELEHMAHVRATGGQGGLDIGQSLRSLRAKLSGSSARAFSPPWPETKSQRSGSWTVTTWV
jgi:hypothetical protein